MAKTGKYIYGIIPCDAIGDNADVLLKFGLELINVKNISAVVGNSEKINLTETTKDMLAKLLVEHQQTIEKIMDAGCSIVPMKLGTVVDGTDEVIEILITGYSFIENILSETNDKIEINILAMWSDFAATLKEISEEKEISEFKQKLMANPAKITVEDQKQIGVMIAEALARKKKNYADKIHKTLSEVSVHAISHEVMNDQMLLNTAFLVYTSEQEKFDSVVNEINNEFENKLNFKYVGPLPCYSFYTLDVEYIDSGYLIKAKKMLNLNDSADINEIKKAYKNTAMKLHPDKNMGKIDDGLFDELNKAYKTISAYCISTAKQDECCSLKRDDISKNTILVKLKD